jgi:hypothetical protein
VVALRKTNKTSKKKADKEMSRLGSALRALGGLGGSAVGNLVGQADAGGGIGRSLGASLSKWLGAGDYAVAANSLLSPTGTIPAMHNQGQSVIVRHKEYIGIINSSAAFSVQYSIPLNPGMANFPWLCKIASSFQEYRIRGMVFHYIPSSGGAVSSTNAALGTVMMQTTYRSTDATPASKLELLNEYWASENVPSQSFCHPIECDPKENPFNVQYVRTYSLPSTENQLMYDLGMTHVATQGQQTTGNPIGDLWVTYEVELKKPVITSNVTSRIFSYTGYWTGTMTTSNFFNGAFTRNVFSTSDAVTSTAKTITFPKGLVGTFSVVLVIGGVSVVDFSSAPTVTNCTLLTYPAGTAGLTSTFTAGGNQGFQVYGITIDNPSVNATLAYGACTWTGSPTTSVIAISQVL